MAKKTGPKPERERAVREILRERRLSRGLTQQQLADAAGVTQVTVARYETGACDISGATLERVLGVLDLEIVPRP